MFTETAVRPLMLGGFRVTNTLYSEAVAIRNRGGKCFLAIEDAGEDGQAPPCPNCNGSGYQYLQHVTGGPYDVATGGKGSVSINEGGKWYTVKTSAYFCVCK